MRRPVRLKLFLVERYVAGKPNQELDRIAKSLQAAVREFNSEGVPVHYLRSTLIAEEESCLCLFEATSAEVVRRLNERAGLSYLRIVAARAAVGTGETVAIRSEREEVK